ncbi:hypothetical protein KR059_012977, partial [Drosophila kikkawai]
QRNKNVLSKDKGLAEMSPKEGSQRQVNKKLVELLLTEAEETGAIFTENNASCESIDDEEIRQDDCFDDESKCRTCSQYLMLDDTVKDLYDKRNIELLHQIKCVTGIWIKAGVQGLPHHICESCQEALKKAIEFRDNCIQANAEFNQIEKDSREGFEIHDEIELELENVLYEESSKHINKAPGIGLLDLEFGSDNEDDFPLHKDTTSPEEDILSGKQSSREREHVCREIASITKCITKEEIGRIESGAEVYKVVLTECNRAEETKPSEREEKPKYSLAVPRRKKPKKSLEEQKTIRRLKHLAKPFSYVCDKCGHAFRMPDQLQIHLLRHNQTKNFACPECPKKFYNSYLRNMHQRVWHRGEKPWSCNHCSETFSNANCRQRHEKEVHGVGPRISMNRSERSQVKGLREKTKDGRHHCIQCAKTYSSKRALAWHMNSHTGERPLKCKDCKKGFAGPAALRRHEMTHDKLPFHCEICLKGFLLRCQLKEHQVVHTGERPYWCEICDIYYRFRRNLDKHNKSDAHKNKVLTTQTEEIEGFPNAFNDI